MRFYYLNATAFIGDNVMLEVFSDRRHPSLWKKLAKQGLQVRNSDWFEFSPKSAVRPLRSPHVNMDRLFGTGRPEKPVRFYAMYTVEKCRHCPHAETDLFVKDVYRIIDQINARWFP